jgi:putative SOS response-associated peptidase YedK
LTADKKQLAEAFAGVEVAVELSPRYNIAPSQPVAVIANNRPDTLEYFQWGLIPSWAKDPKIGNRMINARAETLAEKSSFKNAYKRRRCLIPASGFYEWRKNPGGKSKTPLYIHLKSGQLLAFAGLWESWHSPDGSNILSCTIITTEPNAFMAEIHNRMPAILQPADYGRWLDPALQNPADLEPLLAPFPAELMAAYPVSPLVNSPANESAACIAPV